MDFYSFRESKIFTKKVVSEITDDSYFGLQNHLLKNPRSGDVISGGNGLRKIRWKAEGRGKRGGSRVIYYFADSKGYIFLLDIYAKNEKSDLEKSQLKELSELVTEWLK
jgi:mRNA-degrading endonuclease RelE of RelBE toxin-antitoxin system